MSIPSDTIAAIATAPGAAGVSIVRISGPQALSVAAAVAGRALSSIPPGAFFHALFVDSHSGSAFDDGMVLVFRAPHSYTGEDVVELQGHGGQTPSRRLLAAAISAGARLAMPGEFTRRAFLNGKIDLTQAEAIADLIASRTDRAARAARAQLDGALGRRLDAIYDAAADACADLEAWLDVEDGEIDPPAIDTISRRIAAIESDIARELAAARNGRLVREGALAVISGVPNIGKSSLMNALLGTARAIVSDEPGTTRDTVEESLSLDGIPVRLADTAGLRDAPGAVEREGVRRARELMARADLHLHLVDAAGAPFGEQLSTIADALPRESTIIVLNKCDLLRAENGAPFSAGLGRDRDADGTEAGGALPDSVLAEWTVCPVSALTGEGLGALKRAMSSMLGADANGGGDADVAASERHRAELAEAQARAANARERLAAGPEGCVLAANELRSAAEALGRITGRTFSDELLDRVFGRFCVGK